MRDPRSPAPVPAKPLGVVALRWTSATLYVGVLAAIATALPLRLQEVLQLAGFNGRTWSGLMKWVAFTPGTAPLNYIFQWPFIAIAHAPLQVRAVSLLSAVASLLVFWRLAEKLRLRRPAAVVAIFAVFPTTFVLGLTASPAAQGVFMVLVATWCFLETLQKPSVARVCVYGAVLTAAIYTTPFAYTPALGYLLFFFRFVVRPQQGRTIWLLLPATFIPLLAYVPFYAWAVQYAGDGWLYEAELSHSTARQLYHALAGLGVGTLACVGLLAVGALVGIWTSFLPTYQAYGSKARWSEPLLQKNIAVFCLFGGALTVCAASVVLSLTNVAAIETETVAPAIPLLILVSAAGLEYFRFGRKKLTLLPVLTAVLIAIAVVQDVQLTGQRRSPNLQALADAVVPQLDGDSCVVFVSERLSPPLFLTLRPELSRRECLNFYHHRVVLAVHPYVRFTEQEDAETFFRGLTFVEMKRMHVGGGELIVLEQQRGSAITPG